MPNDHPTRPFADILTEINKGRSHTELSEQFHELVAAVIDTGKQGKLTYTLTVGLSKGTDDILSITDAVTVRAPSAARPSAIYFLDADGNIRRDNPAQSRLPLRGLGGEEDDLDTDNPKEKHA